MEIKSGSDTDQFGISIVTTADPDCRSGGGRMSKFKIEKGISRITRVKLQASIEESIAADLALLCEWSNNDKNYVVNELLHFALSQDREFQSHKASLAPALPAAESESQTTTKKTGRKSETKPPEPGFGVYRQGEV